MRQLAYISTVDFRLIAGFYFYILLDQNDLFCFVLCFSSFSEGKKKLESAEAIAGGQSRVRRLGPPKARHANHHDAKDQDQPSLLGHDY